MRSKLTNYGNEKLAVEAFFGGRAMGELEVEQPWLKSMIDAIVHRHVTEMTQAKWLKCIGKSVMSAVDVGTDISSATIYLAAGDTSTAAMLFGLTFASMACQLMLVAAIHSHDWRFMIKEMLWTLTGLRSGLLHKRILTKYENRGAMDVGSESVAMKGIEVSNISGKPFDEHGLTLSPPLTLPCR